MAVTVPATGTLTVTVAPGTVTLTEQGTAAPQTATGILNTITVADTRNTYPGWSVSAQDSAFIGSGAAGRPSRVTSSDGRRPAPSSAARLSVRR